MMPPTEILGITARVAKITLDGKTEQIQTCLFPSTTEDLVPGPRKPLRVGIDDEEIQNIAQENVMEIHRQEKSHVGPRVYFVVQVEDPVLRLDNAVANIEWRVLNLILASTLTEAIELFEDENGKRQWLAYSDKTRLDRQLGIARIRGDLSCRRVRIERIRKDCVLEQT